MIESTPANLWVIEAQARVITTNGTVSQAGACIMGRGCALEAKQRFPGIEFDLGKRIVDHGNHVYLFVYGGDRIVTFPVKNDWSERANLDLIVRSARELVVLTDHEGWQKVALPRPGCGAGWLSWQHVKPVIEKILDDRFVVVDYAR